MKSHLICLFLLFYSGFLVAQDLTSYDKATTLTIYSEALNDSVHMEVVLPKELKDLNNLNKTYPIIYLLDKQLSSNYKYNLQTIDYLSNAQWMPKALIIGINFSYKSRNSWTLPNESGGKADDLIQFIEQELYASLKSKYPVSDFNLLVGHSRTAIFSSYALSKNPEFFNGVIASSVSNFDFGSKYQQTVFEDFLTKISTYSHQFYYYFSVGEEAYGDLHESAVDSLNTYLIGQELPENFQWKCFKLPIAHGVTPGLTVGNALSDIFKDYGRRMHVCFDIAKSNSDKVPWGDFLALYGKLSSQLGFKIVPAELFYNSMASDYYNDYKGIYGDNHLIFTLEILLEAIEKYPKDFGYFSWIGEIYMTLEETEKGIQYLTQAEKLINEDKEISEEDRVYYLEEIETLKR